MLLGKDELARGVGQEAVKSRKIIHGPVQTALNNLLNVTIWPIPTIYHLRLVSIGRSQTMASRCLLVSVTGAAFLALFGSAYATGLATCDSGDPSKWMSDDQLKAQLVSEGYEVRRIKVDGGCYEAYVIDASGEMSERYYNPVDLTFIPTNG